MFCRIGGYRWSPICATPVREGRWITTAAPWLIAAGLLAGAAAVGLVWLIVLGVLALITWISAHLALLAAVGVAALVLLFVVGALFAGGEGR